MNMSLCYICLEEESKGNSFCDIRICDCKGTVRIHKICYSNIRFKGFNKCSICTAPFRQDVKKKVVVSNDYRRLTTMNYKNDTLESFESRSSTIVCCTIM